MQFKLIKFYCLKSIHYMSPKCFLFNPFTKMKNIQEEVRTLAICASSKAGLCQQKCYKNNTSLSPKCFNQLGSLCVTFITGQIKYAAVLCICTWWACKADELYTEFILKPYSIYIYIYIYIYI
jgi:hypothetical protein